MPTTTVTYSTNPFVDEILIMKVNILKKILIIFFLFFSSLTFADDLKKFKIEGMSLGDSVIDHFPGRDVVNNINSKYNRLSDEYHVSDIFQHSSFKKFDMVSLFIQSDNEETLFPISGMSGLIYYENNIENCYVEKDKIVEELTTIFKEVRVEGPAVLVHPNDLTGESHYEETKFYFDWGVARVACYDMAKHLTLSDALLIDFFYQEVDDWLQKQFQLNA